MAALSTQYWTAFLASTLSKGAMSSRMVTQTLPRKSVCCQTRLESASTVPFADSGAWVRKSMSPVWMAAI